MNLSYTVVAFTKQTMGFLEEALKLYFPELHMVLWRAWWRSFWLLFSMWIKQPSV